MFDTMIYDGKKYVDFEINELGQIRNRRTNHIYKFSTDKAGYLRVSIPLGKRGCVKIIRVHKAVAETYIPNPNHLPVVHHKDENKRNPHITNLEWVTHKQNTNYHLMKESEKTEFFNNRKLSKTDVEHIRESKGKISALKLAKYYDVSKTTIINVQKRIYYMNIA